MTCRVNIQKQSKSASQVPNFQIRTPWPWALGLFRFGHCGAWNLYDFHQPSTLCYYWNNRDKCFERSQGLRFARIRDMTMLSSVRQYGRLEVEADAFNIRKKTQQWRGKRHCAQSSTQFQGDSKHGSAMV